MRKLSTTVIKDYVANTLGNSFAFDNFFAWEHFNIDFLLFSKNFKHQGPVCTSCHYCNWFFNGKRLFKNNYQKASFRIATIL